MRAGWVKTMEREGVRYRGSVAILDRHYRAVREALNHPEDIKLREVARKSNRQLYRDAHEQSDGVPLSDREFKKIGLSKLPPYSKADRSQPQSRLNRPRQKAARRRTRIIGSTPGHHPRKTAEFNAQNKETNATN